MLVTEEEAKGKWCPDARASDTATDTPLSVNRIRVSKADPDCLCLASGCMAWRWAGEAEHEILLSKGDRIPDGYQPTGRVSTAGREVWKKVSQSRFGYCGKAGRPSQAEA